MSDTKLNKQLEKLKKQHKEQRATYRREHYKKVSYPLHCPYCQRLTNFNLLYLHNKTARCLKLKKLLLDEKPDLERNILIKNDMMNKILLKYDKNDNDIIDILNRIVEADKPQLINIDINDAAATQEPHTY
jgi:hypothetical protein